MKHVIKVGTETIRLDSDALAVAEFALADEREDQPCDSCGESIWAVGEMSQDDEGSSVVCGECGEVYPVSEEA